MTAGAWSLGKNVVRFVAKIDDAGGHDVIADVMVMQEDDK